MKEYCINTIKDFNDYHCLDTFHPMVSVIRKDTIVSMQEHIVHFGLYVLFLKETDSCKMSYGRTEYDFDSMSVTSFAPGQTVKVVPNSNNSYSKLVALAFHPDFLKRTGLGGKITGYPFFNFSSNEALHMSCKEVETYMSVISLIEKELDSSIDRHTKDVLISYIELLLNHCLRFYDRQFITRVELNHNVIKKFDSLLNDFLKGKIETEGIPTVGYFADKCCLTSAYFGELVKLETGLSAKSYISEKVLAAIKQKLCSDEMSLQEIAYSMGFKSQSHFVRFFKSHTGMTPGQWRRSN